MILLAPSAAPGQGTREDYQRAATLRERLSAPVLNARISPQWIDGGERLWFVLEEPEGQRRWVMVDARTGEMSPAFDHERMARALAEVLGDAMDATRLPIDRLRIEAGELLLIAGGQGSAWRTDRDVGSLELIEAGLADGFGRLPQARQARSTRTGAESGLVFVNQTDGPVRLVWRDTGGRPREYGTVAPGQRHSQHTFAGHVWEILAEDGTRLGLYEAPAEPAVVVIDTVDRAERGRDADAPRERRSRARGPDTSPDGRWEVRFEGRNAHLHEAGAGEVRPLTEDGREGHDYRGPVLWSPDARLVAFMRHKSGGDRRVHYVESAPRDQVQPKLQSYPYLKPGDPIPQDRPVLFDVESGREIDLEDTLFDNPWSISQAHWSPDGAEFRFLYNQRGHQVMRLIGVRSDGSVRAIIDETSPTFIDYSQKTYLHRLPETDELIWASERDGWNHLYLYDAGAGQLRHQITRGQWVVRGVERVDAEAKQIWFTASGIIPGQDPYHIHFCRVNFDGSGLVVLTEGDGNHAIQRAPDDQTFIATYARVDLPPVTELRRMSDGSLVARLAEADASALESQGWAAPERFHARGRDGETDIWGVIWRPTNFDADKKYPIIENIYAGPHGAHVPKNFRVHYGHQELAELGFIVVQIDGMGTNHRGKAFHDIAWKNLADAGFPDRIAWIRAAADHEPAMDLSRVGIYGGSAGGQNALRALLDHGDFYHAAVADCGCHDNRMDKIWWNEAWMGWPVDESYERSSNVADAHKLRGKLLLVVGEADTNVDPASTMQVVDALVRADKDFDLLVMPNVGHGALGHPYAKRRFHDFFVRHLWHAEPRREE